MSEQTNKPNAMYKVAAFIVDKRQGFILFFVIAAIFCAISSGWVVVNDDITSYLPDTTETRRGLDIMEEEFTTFGTAKVMVDNITYSEAEDIADRLEKIEGVSGVEFDDTEDHYKNSAALFDVTFDGEETDEISVEAMKTVREELSDYDTYISSSVGEGKSDLIAQEMNVVILIVAGIILLVLLLTSQTYAEIPVLVLTFGAAAILNKGTNYMLGEISFVSNSIAVVLQLALAIDYAIILCHRYTEERVNLDAREAVVVALSKSIPEISSSCLTTISGMLAMMFMQFGLGKDLGIVLVKAIFFSLLSVFALMPGLLMMFSKLIDKTHHKNFIPDVTVIGKFAVKSRYIIAPIFALLLIIGCIASGRCNYVYGYSTLSTVKKSESTIAEERIDEVFGTDNMMVIMVPNGDYEKEGKLLRELESLDITESALGLSNVEIDDGDYVLTDSLTPRQFAELTDLDIDIAKLLYTAYAADQESYGQIVSGLESYSVPLIDMFDFLYEQKEKGYVELDADLEKDLDDLNDELTDAKAQLLGENYSRMLIYTNLPEEGEETFAELARIHDVIYKYYPEDSSYLVGDSTSDFDLSSSFVGDSNLISVLTALFVIIILVFTFNSAGLPILLMMVIQGSIWMNFSYPTITNTNIFFLSFLIVSSIQMGANIDYAIVVCTRYNDLKRSMPIKEAAIAAVNQAFPTILTSGSILCTAGSLIGLFSSDCAIASVGECIGRGTLISIILVLIVLPEILVIGDRIVEKTSFTLKRRDLVKSYKGVTRVNGRVRGYVNGFVDARITGLIHGDVNAVLSSDSISEEKLEAALKSGEDGIESDDVKDDTKGETVK